MSVSCVHSSTFSPLFNTRILSQFSISLTGLSLTCLNFPECGVFPIIQPYQLFMNTLFDYPAVFKEINPVYVSYCRESMRNDYGSPAIPYQEIVQVD